MAARASAADGGDRDFVLWRIRNVASSEDIQPELDRLVELLPMAGGVDAEVLRVLGEFCWRRSLHGPDQDEPSAARALLLLLPIFLDDPAAVPVDVRDLLADQYGSPALLSDGDRDVLRGVAFLGIAEEFDQPGLLDPGIDALERAARSGDLLDAERAEVLDSLGKALCARFDQRVRTGSGPGAADLATAADCFRRAYLLSGATDPLRWGRMGRCGIVLVQDPADAEASNTGVELLCQAIGATSTGEERQFQLAALAGRLAHEVPFPLEADAFALACATVDRVAEAAGPTDADRPQLLGARLAAAGAMYARGDHTAGQRAIALSGELIDPALPPAWLAGLAELLRAMCDTPTPALVDAAVAVHRRLIEATPGVNHGLDIDLATLLRAGHRLSAGRSRLQESSEILRRVLRAAEPGSERYLRARYLLSVVLTDLASYTGDVEDVELAIESVRIVVESGEPSGAMPTTLNNLGLLLRLRHELTGAGLAEAIDAMRAALALDEASDGLVDPALHAARRANLAVLLAQDGQFAAAISAIDEAMRLAPRGAPEVPAARTTVLRLVHDHRGGGAELDRMIAALRALVESAPDPVARATHNADLGVALRRRYTEAGDSVALSEAIAAYRRALRILPATHRMRVITQANLMVALGEQAGRTGDPADLDEAIWHGREVVEATPEDFPELGTRLTNLARLLTLRFRSTQDRRPLDEAIELDRRAVDATSADEPARGARLNNLAMSLTLLADATQDPRVMSLAVEAMRQAVAATAADHVQRGPRLANLALGLVVSAAMGGRRSRGAVREAQRVAEQAVRLPTTPSARRIAYRALGIGAAAEGRWAAAAEAFTSGVRQLPLIAGRNLRRADAEHRLAGAQAVHMDAAACAVQAKNPEAALTALEQGRGVLLAYAIDARTELTDLQDADPALAAEVRRVLDALENPDDGDESSDQRHRLRASWDDVLTRVRAQPGFAHFAAAPPIDALLPAARSGPVVVVNVSEYRCDALIVLPTGVRVVPLRRLTADDVAARARAFLGAVESTATGDAAQRARGEAEIRDTYGWLWDAVAEPVLDALGFGGPLDEHASWPHVWWSPTGLLQFLPLHAAGHHDRPGRSVLDRVVSSYTPTVRALQHARSRRVVVGGELVSVAMSQTSGHDDLPATVAEAGGVAATAPRSRLLADDAATFDAVTAALRECPTAHFACHAVSDLSSPSENRLLLHDRPLTVREISRLRLPDAEFAFLSACSTARGDERLADESIHLVSAFQLAGYRHVVGTLWPILDSAAARVTRQFYAQRRGLPPAEALHAVVRRFRADAPQRPSVWSAHVHSGP
jgi:tetratricopeptide (TPR) repeat protein